MNIRFALMTGILVSITSALVIAQDISSGVAAASAQSGQPTASEAIPAEAAEAEKPPEAKKAEAEEPNKMSSAEIVLAAKAAGYKVVDKQGTELFCKKDDVLGSRLRKRTRCLTAAEIEQERTAASDSLVDMSRNSYIPQGD